ncbi:MAG: bifunctional GNAT family N-acetyltransferase/carbon-nitrogen hydrolase family protein [Pseudomonadota bacterium]
MASASEKPLIQTRLAEERDIDAIIALVKRVYPGMGAYTPGMLRGQRASFPEGQLVVEMDGEIVGFSASFRIAETHALSDHTWSAITGGGYASRHDPDGDWLYGMEVCVDPERRRLRIGQRLYDARNRLAEDFALKGVVFGGRLPGYAKRKKQFESPEDYLEAVKARRVRDPVALFQLRAGFEPMRILHDYLPSDHESAGLAALMVRRNPYFDPSLQKQPISRRDPAIVRVTSVQLQARAQQSLESFFQTVEYFVDVASDYRSDFVVFPELFTLQLLAMEKTKLTPEQAIDRLTEHKDVFVERLNQMAISYNINIIGGSHPTKMPDGDIHNIAYVFLRDGSVHAQEKLHPTPDERHWWGIQGGDEINAIQTDCGPIGVLICYDSEFPELARRLADQGAKLLFVPFCTDTRQGYLRVRYCSAARAIENQCYVVLSGNVGNLPNVENMDIQYAQSAILTPCDYPFARDGIAAEASENVEMVAVADLDLEDLSWARSRGAVRNLKDRRFDLYRTLWRDGG